MQFSTYAPRIFILYKEDGAELPEKNTKSSSIAQKQRAQVNNSARREASKCAQIKNSSLSLSAMERIHSSTWCTYFVWVCVRLRRRVRVSLAMLHSTHVISLLTALLYTEIEWAKEKKKESQLIWRREKRAPNTLSSPLLARWRAKKWLGWIFIGNKWHGRRCARWGGGGGGDFICWARRLLLLDAGHAGFFLVDGDCCWILANFINSNKLMAYKSLNMEITFKNSGNFLCREAAN